MQLLALTLLRLTVLLSVLSLLPCVYVLYTTQARQGPWCRFLSLHEVQCLHQHGTRDGRSQVFNTLTRRQLPHLQR
jgi:hypothetical protein